MHIFVSVLTFFPLKVAFLTSGEETLKKTLSTASSQCVDTGLCCSTEGRIKLWEVAAQVLLVGLYKKQVPIKIFSLVGSYSCSGVGELIWIHHSKSCTRNYIILHHRCWHWGLKVLVEWSLICQSAAATIWWSASRVEKKHIASQWGKHWAADLVIYKTSITVFSGCNICFYLAEILTLDISQCVMKRTNDCFIVER